MGRVEFIQPDANRLWYVEWRPEQQTWAASYEPWPPDLKASDAIRSVAGQWPGEVTSPEVLLGRLRASHQLVAPPEVVAALRAPTSRDSEVVLRFWTPAMFNAPPWQVGTESQRWAGYLDPSTTDPDIGGSILRNRGGATTWDRLRTVEDARFAVQQATLRAAGHPRSYDLDGYLAMHKHLFGDVYPWAGELRTVGLEKAGGLPFLRPTELVSHFNSLSDFIVNEADLLRNTPDQHYPLVFATVYQQLNTWHGLRETNGRTNREFLTALARESGRTIDWTPVHGYINDHVSIQSMKGNMRPMIEMLEGIITRPKTLELPEGRAGRLKDVYSRADALERNPDRPRALGRDAPEMDPPSR